MPGGDFQKYIDMFKPVMEAMQALLGDCAEFILHNLYTPQNSVVVVVGNVTGRMLGAPTTNLVMETLQKHGNDAPDMLGYHSVAKDGRQLKSATIFIRDDNGIVVGCLCYNIDVSGLRMAEGLIRNMCHIENTAETGAGSKGEVFAQDISEVMEDIVRFEISSFNKTVPSMSRNDKLHLVASLESKGVFAVKGSAETVASYLGSSVYTIYNYLKEIRNGHKVNGEELKKG